MLATPTTYWTITVVNEDHERLAFENCICNATLPTHVSEWLYGIPRKIEGEKHKVFTVDYEVGLVWITDLEYHNGEYIELGEEFCQLCSIKAQDNLIR